MAVTVKGRRASRNQRKNAQLIYEVGRNMGASPREIKAALATAVVESRLKNLGREVDHDSLGLFQQRASWGSRRARLNRRYSAGLFYRKARAYRGRKGSAGDLAAWVQRPAAQYAGRYNQHSGEASTLVRLTSRRYRPPLSRRVRA